MEGRNTQALPPSDSNSKINSKINPNTATATTNIDFPAPVVTTPAVAIRNPYASGKISNNAISKSNSNSNSNNTTTTAAGQSSDAKVRLSTPGITAAAAATASKTVSSNENHRQNQKQKEQQQQQEPQQHQQPAYWERLPSRTVSFTPAEVLTVTECLKQDNDGRWSIARLYCEEGRSVRITGILDHRSSVLRHRRRDNNANDNNDTTDANDDETCADSTMVVVMEVRDPMTTTTQATAERAKAKQQCNSTLVTPATKFKKRRRSSSSKLPTTTTRSALSSKRKKRPWFASSSSSALGSNKATITPAKKNPSTSNTITHTDSASETLRVIVDAKSVVGADQSLAAAVVGSFVTVIGEFVVAATSSSEPALRCYELEARTLRVINHHHVEASASASTSTKATTDMVFYEKALALRRKTMYERYYYASNEMKSKRNGVDNDNDNGNGNNNDKPMLLQGCGPPPYDVYHRELAVDQSSLGELGKKEPQANTV